MGTTLTFNLEPSVAVVSTVLNEREGIAALLDGFLGQTHAPDEIVVPNLFPTKEAVLSQNKIKAWA